MGVARSQTGLGAGATARRVYNARENKTGPTGAADREIIVLYRSVMRMERATCAEQRHMLQILYEV